MNWPDTNFLALAAIFAVVAWVTGAAIIRGKRNPFLLAFLGGQLAFVYGLPIQVYSIGIPLDTLLLGHFLLLAYFILVLIIATAGVRSHVAWPLSPALLLPTTTLVAICLAWVIMKTWLLVQYGPFVFAFSRATSAEIITLPLSQWEVLISSFTGLLLPGALAIFVIRHAMGHRTGLPAVVVVVTTFLVFMVSGESPVGARRLVLILALVWLGAKWVKSHEAPFDWVFKHWRIVMTALLILIGLSAYYQSIRNNLADETIASDVLSQDPSRFVHGFARFFIPQADSTNGTEAADSLNRPP